MRNPLLKLALLLAVATPLLQGCLAVVVGGAIGVGAGVAHDRRDAGTVLSDRRLSISASDAINRDKDFGKDDNYVHSIVYNGTVLLCGEVHSLDLKQRAEASVRPLQGVARVVNEIEVTDEPQGFWRRREDNTTTARVKGALLNITSMPGFDPTRVNVTTVHGVVYLMGLVTHEEADAVVEEARNVGGVGKVVKVFEFTD